MGGGDAIGTAATVASLSTPLGWFQAASPILSSILKPTPAAPAGPSSALGTSSGTSNPVIYTANDSHQNNSGWTVATSGSTASPTNWLTDSPSFSPDLTTHGNDAGGSPSFPGNIGSAVASVMSSPWPWLLGAGALLILAVLKR